MIDRALEYIVSQQREDGGFDSYWSKEGGEFDFSQPRQTTFFPSLVALALTEIDESSTLRGRVTEFLIAQKSSDWSFNYWKRNSQMAATNPYPDDLDDTFCALAALHNEEPGLFGGEAMAAIAHLLFSTEVQEGGPYRTWLVAPESPKEWFDVDPAVNANIAFFLGRQGVQLPGHKRYFETLITSGLLGSPYYPEQYPIIYFLSRSGICTRAMQRRLCRIILRMQGTDFWGGPMNAALCMSSLLRNGHPPDALAKVNEYLMKSQGQDGSWSATGFCIDSRMGGKCIVSAGASSLTTAFCLEALTLYRGMKVPAIKKTKSDLDRFSEEVKKQFQREIGRIKNPDLRKSVREIYKRVLLKDDSHNIIAQPFIVALALDRKVPRDFLINLAFVSLWGWMAYTIYDDFLDEIGDRDALPGANFCTRKLTFLLKETLPDNVQFQDEAQNIMDKLDAANAWEIARCRVSPGTAMIADTSIPDYSDYWQLSDRSMGNALSGLGVLYAAGYDTNSRTLKGLREFFKNYLIARQLNDDAHDWELDLQNGHINSAAAMLLKDHGSEDIDMSFLREKMWGRTILDICDIVDEHIKLAKAALQSDYTLQRLHFMPLLDRLSRSTANTRKVRRDTLDFIKVL